MNIKEKIIDYFFDLLSQPRISGQTDDFFEALKNEFERLGATVTNENGVLVATVEPSEDCYNDAPIIIQSHLDMIGVKTADAIYDFFEDPLKVQLDESLEWISAVETNFGAVSGIAIIYMLLLLNEENFSHPYIYFILTPDKETGMRALENFDFEKYKDAYILFNLDHNKAGEMIISSPGKEIVEASYNYEKKLTLGSTFQLRLFGSSIESSYRFIADNPSYHIKILAHIVGHLLAIGLPLQIVSINCGGDDSHFVNEASIEVVTSLTEEQFLNAVTQIVNVVLPCYETPNLKLRVTPLKKADKLMAFNRQNSGNIVFNLLFLPEGVEYSRYNVPVASADIISCQSTEDKVYIKELIKFADYKYEGLLKSRISLFYSYTQGFIKTYDLVLPWLADEDSNLGFYAFSIWKELTGENLELIHAPEVMEVPYFANNLGPIDIISIGTTVENPGTPDERLELKTAVEVYEFLKLFIEKIAKGTL